MAIFQQIKNLNELSLCATAIGSLPHDNPDLAVDLSFKTFKNCPFWPQLSNINRLEDMTAQYLQGLPSIEFDNKNNKFFFNTETELFFEKLEEFFLDYESIITEKNYKLLDKYKISDEYSSAIDLFFNKLAETKPSFAKGHIIGPLTMGLSICGSDGKNAIYDDVLNEVIIKGLTLKAIWQIREMKAASPDTTPIIFLDEPAMSQYGTSALLTITKTNITAALNEISTIIQNEGALCGVHCCGKTDWSIITDSNINILNFDAFSFSKSLSIYLKDIEKFLNNGNFIAWGIVPTLDENALSKATTDSLLKIFNEAVDLLCEKGLNKNRILRQSIITPSCGAGGLSEILATKALKLTTELSTTLKNK